jgi:NAD(P)-dependent dehydrogenase (short-subunit alcohol dehydrogenase family)
MHDQGVNSRAGNAIMKPKVVLITGTSTGLGAATALQLALKGHTVYATMRDLSKKGDLAAAMAKANAAMTLLQLDVQDMASVTAAAEAVVKAEGRIDVLINNAGAGYARSTEQASLEEVHWVMDLNFMGVVRATKAVIPHMRKARAGHIVNISSVGGLLGQPFNEIYCAAKFAVEGYTEALASYVQPHFGIKFTAVEPGGISSAFFASAVKKMEETGGFLNDEYAPLMQKYRDRSRSRGASAFQTPDQVAEVVVKAVESADPPVRIRTSAWAEDLCALKTASDPDGKKLQRKVISDFLGD